MKHIVKRLLLLLIIAVSTEVAFAQSNRWRDMHKVKKKETLYSICRDYDITLEELKKANPEMTSPDYVLKKGTIIFIPFAAAPSDTPVVNLNQNGTPVTTADDVKSRVIRLGILLPLHNNDGDGKRMVEYYRGILMACDSLKKEGISIEVFAWNLPLDGSVQTILADPQAAKCDLMIGPLYSKYVKELSDFTDQHKILLVIPFSIEAPELYTNRYMFQVYQHPNELNESTSRRFADWFSDCHPIIVDAGDETSNKGLFTAAVRQHLDTRKKNYSLTHINTTDDYFVKCFKTDQRNVVLLNTARFSDMNALFGKLSTVAISNPSIQIEVFGYTEWLTQASRQLENFYRYNVYVPSHFFTNVNSPATISMSQKYRHHFRQEMMQLYPRFALTGFDHAYFFLKGLHKYGKTFDGAAGRFGYPAVQTPLKFERIGNGGLQNRAFMFVHYKPDHQVELLNY